MRLALPPTARMEGETDDKKNNNGLPAEEVNPDAVQIYITEDEVNQMTPWQLVQCAIGRFPCGDV